MHPLLDMLSVSAAAKDETSSDPRVRAAVCPLFHYARRVLHSVSHLFRDVARVLHRLVLTFKYTLYALVYLESLN
jgi:hypothetical protein